MKRIIPITIVLVVLVAFVGTLWFLYQKSQKKPVVYETSKPLVTDIIKKTVATGAIVPRKEVEIKPRASGIIQSIHVEPGEHVEENQLIAQIRVVPNMASLNQAESRLEAARISFQNAKRELARNKNLLDKGVTSEAEYNRYKLDFELKQQEVETARNNLQIVREGAARKSGKTANNTQVRSTVAGMVLEVPVKQGASVIESNTFNPGTTVAVIADMGDMIFQGQVDESEVGKLKEGMELDIKVGALDNEVFKGKLEYIAPKGVQAEGVIQFEVKAAIQPKEGVFIRAGYSANADIVLDRRSQVLAISERVLQFDKDKKSYVEVEVAPQNFERRDVEVGLSDGLNIEILSGISKDDTIKKP